jgi:hypothetical protein
VSDESACICGHSLDSHDEILGFCTTRDCRCICYRTELDEDDETEELDFEEDADR